MIHQPPAEAILAWDGTAGNKEVTGNLLRLVTICGFDSHRLHDKK